MTLFKNLRHLLLMALTFLALPAHADLRVFACEPVYQAMANIIGGERVHVDLATTALQDPHRIQARPSLIVKVRRADMVACHGADLEVGWLPLLLRRANNRSLMPGQPGYFMGTEHVRVLGKAQRVDRSLGDVHAYGNPHIQTSPANILPLGEAMTEAMAQLSPGDADWFSRRWASFARAWQGHLERWQKLTQPLRGMAIVVHHDSWVYLEDYLDLDKVGTLEEKPGIPPTSGHLSSLVKTLEQHPAKVIIYAAYQDPKAARWLAERTGIPVVKLPFTIGGTEEASDLVGLYDDTFARLLEAVQR
jgi:zinc/manganese transport system substrate-binding protein